MSQVSDYAYNRLAALLPLAERQATLSPELRKIHQAFLRSLAERGRMLTEAEVAAMAPGHDAFAAIWMLKSLDLIVLGHTGEPVGAYPLTLEQTPHEVIVNGNTLYAMCPFDALGVGPMFNTDAVVRSRCPITGVRITLRMSGSTFVDIAPQRDVQIGVWWRDPGSCAAKNLCTGIVALRDRNAALQWQGKRTGDHDFASLADAVDAAERFFSPLMVEAPEAVAV